MQRSLFYWSSMIFHEEFILKAPHTEAWEFFSDFPDAIGALPGLISVKQKNPQLYTGAVQIALGPFTFWFEGEIRIRNVDYEEFRVVLDGDARDTVLGARFKATAYAQTVSDGPNQSRILLEVHVGWGGMLGKVGNWALTPQAGSVVERYRLLCERSLERRRRERVKVSPPLPSPPEPSPPTPEDTP